MKVNLTAIQKQRQFSEEFKRTVVNEFESGKFSVPQLGRIYKIHVQIIYRWIYKYSNFNEKSIRIVEMKESSSEKLKNLEKKVKELERAVGQKQLYIDYMEKMMEIAKEDLGIDIKKNFGTPQSTGSEKTKKK
jgi:transposase